MSTALLLLKVLILSFFFQGRQVCHDHLTNSLKYVEKQIDSLCYAVCRAAWLPPVHLHILVCGYV